MASDCKHVPDYCVAGVGTAKINTTFSDWSQLENGREPPSKIGPLLERIAELQNAVDSLHLALVRSAPIGLRCRVCHDVCAAI